MDHVAEPIAIELNGEPRAFLSGGSVAELLRSLGRDPAQQGVAVAVNMEVVPRSEYSDRRLVAGDRVDVVTAVGGG